jgi:hypothetical protein
MTEERRKRVWHIIDLVTNHQTGRLRETAFWSNVCKLLASGAYVKYVRAENYETMTAVLVGALVVHEVVKAQQNQNQQKIEKETPNAQPTRAV